jgi:hypothetical protein
MIATKAVAAILMTGLGSLAAGTAAYFDANPRAPAHETKRDRAPPSTPAPLVPVPIRVVVEQPPVQNDVLMIDPVVITGRELRPPKALAKPVKQVQGPCSDWQGLATGPSERKVRLLCPK